jgi:single-strand DNA-binding protein
MINKVILVGNLGSDPEVRHLETSVVAKLSVATNENYRDKSGEWQKITEWHNVVAWRGLAENIEKNYKKGMQVYVEGKLTTRKWQDKDGNDRYSTEVVANTMRILGSRDQNESLRAASTPATTTEAPKKPAEEHTDNFSDNAGDDDLPF